MTHRIWALALTSTLLTVSVFVAAPTAMADDEPPCLPPMIPILGMCLPPAPPAPVAPAPTPAPPIPVQPPVTHVVRMERDHRPCVAAIEYRSAIGMTKNGIVSRTKVEEHWEVSGDGVRRLLGPIGMAFVYPRCGYRPSDAYYAAAYDQGRLVAVTAWKADYAVLSGRP